MFCWATSSTGSARSGRPADRGALPTGARAAIAASILYAAGVREVSLYGSGFAEWSAAGQPVETASA